MLAGPRPHWQARYAFDLADRPLTMASCMNVPVFGAGSLDQRLMISSVALRIYVIACGLLWLTGHGGGIRSVMGTNG